MITKGYRVKWAPFSATAPTTWEALENCIRKLPNFFPDPESVDNSVVTNTMKTSEPGVSGGEALAFTVAVIREFLEAHAEMVTEQADDKKGFFWMEVEFPNRGTKVTFKAKTVTNLPTPENELGSLDEITWNVYPQGDIAESKIVSA